MLGAAHKRIKGGVLYLKRVDKNVRNLLFCGLILLFVYIAGCGFQTPAAVSPLASSAAEKPAPRTMVDHLNRTVHLPAKPERVLALTRNFMEEMFALGLAPIGKVDEYVNRPEGKALPNISKQSAPNIEAIINLKPDVIIANTRQHVPMLETLQTTGAAVFFIDPGRSGQDPLTGRIQLLGEILNRSQSAKQYTQQLESASEELKQQVAGQKFLRGIILDGAGDMTKAAQPTGFYGALLQRLGIQNIVSAGLPGANASTWVTFDREAILKASPDVILIKSPGKNKDSQQKLLDAVYGDSAWQETAAVKTRKVFLLPTSVDPGGMDSIEALRTTARILTGQQE